MSNHDYPGAPNDPADFTGADAEYFETPPGAGYEHTDASVWTIARFGFWLVISALVIHGGVALMYMMLTSQSESLAEPRYPMAATRENPQPPEPRLQKDPASDIFRFRLEEQARLDGYGWVNREAGVVHIPIQDAMRQVVEQGLPARALDPAQPAVTPGLYASDSSAGRVMERRRQ
jgi:hypothetical protein